MSFFFFLIFCWVDWFFVGDWGLNCCLFGLGCLSLISLMMPRFPYETYKNRAFLLHLKFDFMMSENGASGLSFLELI